MQESRGVCMIMLFSGDFQEMDLVLEWGGHEIACGWGPDQVAPNGFSDIFVTVRLEHAKSD